MPKKRMSEHGENLTSEALCRKYSSHFEFVNHAIKLAENFIYSGRAPRVPTDESQSVPSIILQEIVEGKDYFEDLPEEDDYAENVPASSSFGEERIAAPSQQDDE